MRQSTTYIVERPWAIVEHALAIFEPAESESAFREAETELHDIIKTRHWNDAETGKAKILLGYLPALRARAANESFKATEEMFESALQATGEVVSSLAGMNGKKRVGLRAEAVLLYLSLRRRDPDSFVFPASTREDASGPAGARVFSPRNHDGYILRNDTDLDKLPIQVKNSCSFKGKHYDSQVRLIAMTELFCRTLGRSQNDYDDIIQLICDEYAGKSLDEEDATLLDAAMDAVYFEIQGS
jgi:hypothetical protein